MKRKIFRNFIGMACAFVIGGCAIPVQESFDASQAQALTNIRVLDERTPGIPTGNILPLDPRRKYLSEEALGPPLIDILRSRLASRDKELSVKKDITVTGIEVSLIAVDNSMEGNSNDPPQEYDLGALFMPTVAMVFLGPRSVRPTSDHALVSVRSTIQFRVNDSEVAITEYGMSTKAKVQPEIKKVYFKVIDGMAERLQNF